MVPQRLRTAPAPSFAVALLSLIGFLSLSGGCDKMPLVAPSGTVINLISTTNVLPINGSTDIIAILLENGTVSSGNTPGTPGTTPAATAGAGTLVHNGTQVSFTTTLGHIEPATTTTHDGQATVKLVADGRSGVATVTAYSGGANKTLTVNVGSAAATRILVAATPQTLPATGGTATVTATVEDQQGNGIAGVPVTFSSTAGTLSATTAVTDSSGNASTTILTSAAATITASAGGGTTGATLTGTVNITILPNSTVTFTAPSGAITVSSPVTFTVGVGSNVITNDVVIDFGDGDKPVSLGAISASTPVQHIYGILGSVNPSAKASFADGTVKTVFAPIVITDYTVTPSCPPNVTFGSSSTFSLSVTPAGVSISGIFWNFGDEGGTQQGSPLTHTWQSRGTKTVTWSVIPTRGPSKGGVCQLEVN